MIYDYKVDNVVQNTVFESIEDFVKDCIDEYYKLHRFEILYIYVPSYIGKTILNTILKLCKETFLHDESDINLLEKDLDIIISVGYDGTVIVESAYWENGVLKKDPDSASVYMYDTFKKKDLDIFENNSISTLVFRVNEENDDDEYDCYDKNEDDTEYVYKINGRNCDKKTYDKILHDMQKDYSLNLKDMLIRYCDLFDKINELYTLF